MADNGINFYSPYYEKGFWFEPERVEPEDANPTQGNAFLNKYWGQGSEQAITLSQGNAFSGYWGGSYGGYTINDANQAKSYDDVMDSFKGRLDDLKGQTAAQNTYLFDPYWDADYGKYEENAAQEGFSYDKVENDFQSELENINPDDNSADKFLLDAYYSADYSRYEEKAAQDGFSYDAVINNLKKELGRENTGTSSATPDYGAYYNNIFN